MVDTAPVPPARPTMVTLPAEIDLINADIVDEAIARACAPGGRVVIADMTATTFCDSMGMRVLVRSCWLAKVNGCDLRLLVPHPNVLRVMELLGIGAIVPIYQSLDEAVAGV